MTKLRRQGDLLIKQVDETPAEGKAVRQITLAEGEITGHHHVLVADVGAELIGDAIKFTLKGTAKLLHPEHTKHADTALSSGTYVVIHEREFDYADEAMKQVQD